LCLLAGEDGDGGEGWRAQPERQRGSGERLACGRGRDDPRVGSGSGDVQR
jgi:hypothetical protein